MYKQAILCALTAIICLVIGAGAALAQDEQTGDDEARYELMYKGEFIDQENEPITGVFPLEFALYASENSKKELWEEKHWVSVLNGQYTVLLGQQNSLPEEAANETVYLGVKLDGRGMIRQPIKARLVSDEYRIQAVPMGGGTAEFAERAADADALGGVAAAQYAQKNYVERLFKEAKQSAGSAAPAPAVGGGSLSGQNWKSENAGGTGGKMFMLNCPDGFVMTGVEGRSGAVIDGFRIICTKLE